MCLNALTKKISRPSNKEVKAWGWFVVRKEGRRYVVQTVHQHTTVARDVWNTVGKPEFLYAPSFNYRIGFHKLAEKADAEKSAWGEDRSQCYRVLLPVTLRKVRTVGRGDGCYGGEGFVCYVADEMFLSSKDLLVEVRRLKKEEGWKF